MRKRTYLAAVSLWMLLGLVSCFEKPHREAITSKPHKPASPPEEKPPESHSERMLWIAERYENYKFPSEEVGDSPGYVSDFSPSRFLAGITPAKKFTSDLDIPITPPVLMENHYHMSRLDDETVHAKKLYLTFSRYRMTTGVKDPKVHRVGQTVVMESWIPEEVIDREKDRPIAKRILLKKSNHTASDVHSEKREIELTPYARHQGKLYYATRKDGLFIMFKVDPKTPDTDDGWVYGTVSPDGKTVHSVGRLESCIKCHRDAPNDRLFGLPETK